MLPGDFGENLDIEINSVLVYVASTRNKLISSNCIYYPIVALKTAAHLSSRLIEIQQIGIIKR